MQVIAIVMVIALVLFLIIVNFEEVLGGIITALVFLLLGIYIIILIVLGITFVAVIAGYGSTKLFGICTFDDIFRNALLIIVGTVALSIMVAVVKKKRASGKS